MKGTNNPDSELERLRNGLLEVIKALWKRKSSGAVERRAFTAALRGLGFITVEDYLKAYGSEVIQVQEK